LRETSIRRVGEDRCGTAFLPASRNNQANMLAPQTPRQNVLLAALPTADYERLAPSLERVPLALGQALYESGGEQGHVYFPVAGIVSLLYVMDDGSSAEIAVVGNDGVVGIALFMGGDHELAVLVFITTVLFPGLEIAAMLYLLASLKAGRIPEAFAITFRLVEAIKPWGMISVFVLGTLVSLVKLHNLATVIPGLALYSLGALILMLTASEAAFETRELWARARALQA